MDVRVSLAINVCFHLPPSDRISPLLPPHSSSSVWSIEYGSVFVRWSCRVVVSASCPCLRVRVRILAYVCPGVHVSEILQPRMSRMSAAQEFRWGVSALPPRIARGRLTVCFPRRRYSPPRNPKGEHGRLVAQTVLKALTWDGESCLWEVTESQGGWSKVSGS